MQVHPLPAGPIETIETDWQNLSLHHSQEEWS
jgi:hypothetical protein